MSKLNSDIRQSAIISAIKTLDREKDYTQGGKPDVKVLEEVLGFGISAEERDAALEESKKTHRETAAGKPAKKNSVITGEAGLKAMNAAKVKKLEQ